MVFHDGTPVDVPAVREALSRVARPSTSSPWAGLVSRVEGFDEVQSGSATHLSGVRETANLEMQIRLSDPFSDLPTVLSHPALIPVSLDSLADQPDGSPEPVCAGPYRIEKGLEGGDLRLVRAAGASGYNEAYLGEGRGRADRILVRSFESREDAYQAYRTGQVDIAPVPDSRLSEALASDPGYQAGGTLQISYLAFDDANPATSDPRLRQAVSLALDRLAIIDAAYGDQRRPATRWLPGDYAAGTGSTCESFARRIDDSEKAKTLLEASGVDSGLELTLFYDPATAGRLVAEALEIQAREVLQLRLQPRPLEGQDILSAYRSRGPEPAVWLMATTTELPLPDQYLGDLFRTGSEKNILQFSDETFDSRLSAAHEATRREDHEELYVKAESAVCDRMPAIPLWTSVSHWAINGDNVRFEGELSLNALGNPILRHAVAVEK